MDSDPRSFNLIDTPWILVQDTVGIERTVSISELFAEASRLRSIGGDVPIQAFAITRVLLAIVRRAIDWGSKPVERWAEIWQVGAFPADEISAYLRSVRDRFDLLHPEQPFYQVADLATAKNEFRPLELILADVPTGEKYFTTRAGKGTESLSLAEAARCLVYCHAYDISGIKSADARDPRGKGGKGYPIGVGWCAQLGGVVFEGADLFQTLMLNTVLRGPDGEGPRREDVPVWERTHPDYRQRDTITPTGPCDLLTWQSRRIRLIVSGERVTKVLVANGDPIESYNRFNSEYMTEWRYSEIQTKKFGENRYFPRQWVAERALWRGIEGLTGDIDDTVVERQRVKTSGTAHWISHLLNEDVLDGNEFIRPHAFGQTYINQASVIESSVDDSVLMPLALLSRNSEARSVAVAAVDSAAEAVRALGALARRLAQAAGGEGTGPQQAAESAAYFALDHEYREWLRKLGDEFDDDVGDDWQSRVHRIVESDGRRLVRDAGAPAWLGREVAGKWIDSSVADNWFRGSLRKALPYAYPSESVGESGDR